MEAKQAPELEWETVATQNFRIHFPTTYRLFTSYLAASLEDAYKILSVELSWNLIEPLDVVVRGDTDIPNGQASVFPFNRLVIHAVPFSPTSSIGEYDDWIRMLAFHELTHIIANDSTRGIWEAGRFFMGSVAKMNSYQPLWLVEGLAVYEETVQGAFGRGRSAFADMVLRTAARDGVLDSSHPTLGVTLDRLNDGVPEWPAANTPYIYGYMMMRVLAADKGRFAPSKISYTNAGYLPFFANSVALDAIGTDYYSLWDTSVERVRQISRSDLAKIRSQPVSPHRPLTDIGRLSRGPALNPHSGEVYFIRDSYSDGSGLSGVDPKSGRVKNLTDWRWPGGTTLRWIEGGSGSKDGYLLYSRIRPYREYSNFSDLYLYDVSDESEVSLTSGLRAFDPDASPDFSWKDGVVTSGALVYIKNQDDGNQALFKWDGKKETELFRGEKFERIANPVWGQAFARDWVVFTYKLNNGNERLMAVNVKTRKSRGITRHADPTLRVSETTPSWSKDGSLYFSSTLGGIFNIYRLRSEDVSRTLESKHSFAIPERLSHLETGAVFPIATSDPEMVLAMVYGKRGFDLAELRITPRKEQPVALDSLHAKLGGGRQGEIEDRGDPDRFWVDWPGPPERSREMRSEEYSVFPALWPKFWLPFVEKIPDGALFGAMSEGFDSLERHRYRLTAAYDTRADFPVYSVMYQYDGLYPIVRIEHRQDNQYVGIFGQSNRVVNNSGQFQYPIGDFDVTFGATTSSWRFFGHESTNGGLQVIFGHSLMRGSPNSLDEVGESGHRADLTFTGYFLGDSQYASVQSRWEQRIPLPWDRHFLRLYLNGAMILDQDVVAPPFFAGGQEAIVSLQDHLVRGYPAGSLFGRKLTTANLEYWIPLKDVHHARGTLPLFYERAKIKLFADTGSADFVAGRELNFSKWPVGIGLEILNDLNLFYHFHFTLGLGFHWGLSDGLAGEKQVTFGLFNRRF